VRPRRLAATVRPTHGPSRPRAASSQSQRSAILSRALDKGSSKVVRVVSTVLEKAVYDYVLKCA
jgi:hypothetical protein